MQSFDKFISSVINHIPALVVGSFILNGILFFTATAGWESYWDMKKQAEDAHAIIAQADAKHQELEAITTYIRKLRPDLNPAIRVEWAQAFQKGSEETGVDPFVALQFSIVESGLKMVGPYGTTLVSHAGAEGIMQVMPQYWGTGQIDFIKKPQDLRHPTLNIRAGMYILATYYAQCGQNWYNAALCYHGGQRALVRPKKSSISYAEKITKRLSLPIEV